MTENEVYNNGVDSVIFICTISMGINCLKWFPEDSDGWSQLNCSYLLVHDRVLREILKQHTHLAQLFYLCCGNCPACDARVFFNILNMIFSILFTTELSINAVSANSCCHVTIDCD